MASDVHIDAVNQGRRLETVLFQLMEQVPRNRLMKWLRTGKIRLNGSRTRPRVLLAHGDVLRLPFDPNKQLENAPWQECRPWRGRPLPAVAVLYEDQDLLIVDKPAHLACHPGMKHGHDTLVARIVQHLNAHDAPVGRRPGLAQRLDAGVTGIVPCGKNAAALRALAASTHTQALRKSYLALLHGNLKADAGSITAPLRVTDAPMGHVPKVVVDDALGKPARTDFLVQRRMGNATWVKLTLHTGRTHQIRAHMRHIGHGLLGDARYGDPFINAYLHETFGIDRPMLHAHELEMLHPITLQPLCVASPVPQDMARLLRAFDSA